MDYTLTIDAGTTSVRALIMRPDCTVVGVGQHEFEQHFPASGWVEHDQDDIWAATLASVEDALRSSGATPQEVARIGITNQRETTCLWDRQTGKPLGRAIVWQDRRTADVCTDLTEKGHADEIRSTTGLVVDAYFSGTKIAWLLDQDDTLRAAADAGDIAFGTVDTMLISRISGGTAHVTEPSNACRTMLYDIATSSWSERMCELLRVPSQVLPTVLPSFGQFAMSDPAVLAGIEAPITGVLGDQQSALFGHGGLQAGDSKVTYGTGSFMLFNTGTAPVASSTGLLTSVGWQEPEGASTYVLEGAIFVTGAIMQWLRDGLQILPDAAESASIAREVPLGCDGVTLVPAFTGLGAPHWDPHARGAIFGLTRATSRAHLVRAGLEAIAHQVTDLVEAMSSDAATTLTALRVDGGAAANDLLCQMQADLSQVPVVRPTVTEMTALGAAKAAWVGAHGGVIEGLALPWNTGESSHATFIPDLSSDVVAGVRAQWSDAVGRTLTQKVEPA